MGFIKSITRWYSCDTIKEWYIGESEYLKKLVGFGFYNTLFISIEGVVEFYYDEVESNEFEKTLENVFDEEFFNKICEDFMKKISNPNIKIREIVPHLTIFNEIDEYPEWIESFEMQKKLLRIREQTESRLYKLMKKDNLKDFIYYKGRLYK